LFLAPWRERGHAISLKFIKKFEYFVPCYYDLEKGRDPDSIELKTSEHYSEEFLHKIKAGNPNVKILPRLYVNGMHGDVFYLAGLEESHMVRLRDHVRSIL